MSSATSRHPANCCWPCKAAGGVNPGGVNRSALSKPVTVHTFRACSHRNSGNINKAPLRYEMLARSPRVCPAAPKLRQLAFRSTCSRETDSSSPNRSRRSPLRSCGTAIVQHCHHTERGLSCLYPGCTRTSIAAARPRGDSQPGFPLSSLPPICPGGEYRCPRHRTARYCQSEVLITPDSSRAQIAARA